jgi:signal transduction histidine kinase
MLKAPSEFIIVFIIVSAILILGMALFISLIIYRYQQKQNAYFKDTELLKTSHENALLQSQLEMQEQTFQAISGEIHDNIGQKLTLAKLYLNTLDFEEKHNTLQQVNNSVCIISETINDLSDLSRSMSSEIILSNGLIKALEYEQDHIKKSGLYKLHFSVSGNPVYLKNNTELFLFRIVQEGLNNIIKHAAATSIYIHLYYSSNYLSIEIRDNGKGFNINKLHNGTGLQNIKKRMALLKGSLEINTTEGSGTAIKIKIPINENK